MEPNWAVKIFERDIKLRIIKPIVVSLAVFSPVGHIFTIRKVVFKIDQADFSQREQYIALYTAGIDP